MTTAPPCSHAEKKRRLLRAFFILLALYCLGIFSILRANRLYLDDIGRALYGYADWFVAARPMAELFSWIFYLGSGTVDASPFTQILAAAFLAAASLCLCVALRVQPTIWALLATVPLGLSPYGLENLSYKFDAPQMALAMLLAIVPFLFFRRHPRIFFITAVLCLFSSASIYQATLGAYLSVSGYILMTRLVSRKKSAGLVRTLFTLALPFFVATGAYAAQASFWFRKAQYADYISMHSVVPPLHCLPREIFDNCAAYATMLRTDWGGNGLGWLLLATLGWFTLFLAGRWARSLRHTGPASVFRLFLLFPLLLCFLLSPLGVQIILQDPVWSPRTLCGFGVIISLMLLALHGTITRKGFKFLLCGLQIFVCLQLVIFAQVYGNLLAAQNNWERSRIAFMAQGLSRFIAETDSTTVIFKGSVGQTPLTIVPARRYPLLGRMVSVPLTRSWRWGYEQLKIYGVYVRPGRPLRPDETLSPYIDTPVYSLEQTADGIAVVSFKAF